MHTISEHDKNILRELAKTQLEYAHSPRNLENIRLWYKHNACQGERPMIHIESGTFYRELSYCDLKCEGDVAREFEDSYRRTFLNYEIIRDDYPILPYFGVTTITYMIPFGLRVQTEYAKSSIGYSQKHPISDLKRDFHLLGPGETYVDSNWADIQINLANDAFGHILPVKKAFHSMVSSPTQHIVALMGMEHMFLSMYDYPDLFHEMMARYVNETMKYFAHVERERAILPTNSGEWLWQGSFCFNKELPSDAKKISEIWGYMDSQETVGISSDMFGEFIFPYYKKIAEQYGLLSYGCCEPVHTHWEHIKTLSNLRKISISPWCDEDYMGDALRETKIIYHRKPAANMLGVGANLDEDAVRESIRKTLYATKGNTCEFTQRDVYTINKNANKARRYVELIRETIDEHWQP